MMRPLDLIKRSLRGTGFAEGFRRAKQALKRRLHSDAPPEPLVPAGPLFDGLPPEVEERLVAACGPDADLAVRVEPTAFLGGRFVLRAEYGIRSLDFANNWMKVALVVDGPEPLDLRAFDGVGLFVDGGGAGGQFLVTLRDEDHGAFAFNSPTVLHGRGFRFLPCDFARFFRPAWESAGDGAKVFSRVRAIEFSVRPGDTPVPHRGHFRVTGLRGLVPLPAAVAQPVRIRSAICVDDLSEGAEDRFALSHGEDAALRVALDREVLHQGRPSLRVECAIRTLRHARNYAVLSRDLPAPLDARGFAGVALFVRAARCGALLRVCLRDAEGAECVAEEPRLLRDADAGDGFRRVFLPLSRFRHPEWARQAAPIRLERLAGVSLALLPGASLAPVEATFHLGGLFLARHAEETAPLPAADVPPLLVDDVLARACAPGAVTSGGPLHEESDAGGPFLAAGCAEDGTPPVLAFPLPEARYLLASEHLFVRLPEPSPFPLALELRTPGGELYESGETFERDLGRDRFVLFPLAAFRKAGGGVRFPDAVRALGHAAGFTLRAGAGAGFLKIRQLGLSSGGSVPAAAPHDLPPRDDAPPSPDRETPPPPAAQEGRFLLAPAREAAPAAARPDPRRLKELDDRSGGEYGLSRVAMFVEPTNLCNLRCIMCNHGDHSFRRGLGVMKARDFKRIAAEIREEKLRFWEFSPYWYGETFIHPQVGEFLAEADDLFTAHGAMKHYNVHTNGANLTEKHLRLIAGSALTSVLFSIDAATAETHAKIRRGGDLSRVVGAVERLLALRAERGGSRPAVIVQFIAMDENAHEMADFARFWAARGFGKLIYAGRPEDNPFPDARIEHDLLFPQTPVDCVFVKALEPNALTKHQTHREALPPHRANPEWRFACASLFRMLAVGWDGEATACCRDDQLEMGIGNVFSDGVVGVYYGERLRELRLAHVRGDLSGYGKCRDCLNWAKDPLPPAEVTRWLGTIGRPELAGPYLARTRRRPAG